MGNRTDRDAFLDEIVQRQQEKDIERAAQDASQSESTGKRPLLARGPVVAALTLVFVCVLIWNVRLMQAQPLVQTVIEEGTSMRMMMAVASLQIEAFRQSEGRLPGTLEEANAPTEGISYLPAGATYRLEATADGLTLTHEEEAGPQGLIEEMAEFAQESGR